MAIVTFVSAAGDHHTVEVEIGKSVMESAVGNGVAGIDADCGGSCACATCHVIVDAEWFDRLVPPENAETAMLEFAVDPQPRSRLSCQIRVTTDLDGLVVHTPVSQR